MHRHYTTKRPPANIT